VFIAYFSMLSPNLFGEAEKNHEKLRIAAEIQILFLQNISLEDYHYSNLLFFVILCVCI
jgi:hypothetical protein